MSNFNTTKTFIPLDTATPTQGSQPVDSYYIVVLRPVGVVTFIVVTIIIVCRFWKSKFLECYENIRGCSCISSPRIRRCLRCRCTSEDCGGTPPSTPEISRPRMMLVRSRPTVITDNYSSNNRPMSTVRSDSLGSAGGYSDWAPSDGSWQTAPFDNVDDHAIRLQLGTPSNGVYYTTASDAPPSYDSLHRRGEIDPTGPARNAPQVDEEPPPPSYEDVATTLNRNEPWMDRQPTS